jgi:hypothetical protein
MFGCPLLGEPVVGGTSAFGPANIPALELARAPLGRDDATLLIQQYVTAFAAELQLDTGQRALLEAFLWEAAEQDIDASSSATLSVCGELPDASAGDAGASGAAGDGGADAATIMQ